jgi:O-acetyl-ADP-ribose deacetylase (regulator of RNase III)
MQWTINGSTFKAEQGDITAQDTKAVVNAANKQLAPGGGVAGAIHRAAGQGLTDHCREMDNCETGQAVITPGFELEADHIVHTVGPVYDGHPDPESALRDSYLNSLSLASGEGIESISFPLLSTGAFGYPVDDASRVAVQCINQFLRENESIDEVRMILWGEDDYETFGNVAREILGEPEAP